MSAIKRNKRGLLLGTAIYMGAFILALPGIPWLKQELIQEGTVITATDGSCVVETSYKEVINIPECDSKAPGDIVTIKFRATTKIGEIIKT